MLLVENSTMIGEQGAAKILKHAIEGYGKDDLVPHKIKETTVQYPKTRSDLANWSAFH